MNLYIVSVDQLNGLQPVVVDVLSFIAIFAGVLVITTKNPVVSVLFLISLFLVIAVNLIVLGMHFIGLSYVLVYIGAISMLFLFTLMLINVRVAELTSYTSNSLPLAFIFSVTIFYMLQGPLPGGYEKGELDIDLASSIKWDGSLIYSSGISSIGNIMYSSHSVWLIATGVILLLAMVGAIAITLSPYREKGSNDGLTTGFPKQTFIKLGNGASQRRFYSVDYKTRPRVVLNPFWITGFVDGEGWFRVKPTTQK